MIDDLKQDAAAHGFPDVSTLRLLKLIVLYPAMAMLFGFRLQQAIGGKNALMRFMRRLVWMLNCRGTGCHIYFNAVIEPGVCLPHPTGIVIGKGCVARSGATVFSNVTLGTPMLGDKGGFPTVESGAVFYAGAVVIGDITVGENAVVGANAVVNSDVAAGVTVGGIPARVLSS